MSTPLSPMPSTPLPQETAEPALSEPARIIDTFVAPSKTFIDIRRNASWWVPLLIVSIFSIAFFILIDKKVGFDTVAQHMIDNNARMSQLPAAQQERTAHMIALSMKVGGYLSPILVLFYGFVAAGVLWLTFNFGMDAQIPFPRAMSVVFYGWLPSVVGTILAMVSLVLGNPEGFRLENPVGTNPAYFLDYTTTSKFTYGMLSSIDVIALWIVILIGMGFALNAKKKISMGTGIGVVAAWYFLFKLGSSAIAALRS
ncbi:MAG: YIP1 family protein [Actinomycetota bacterium]